MGRQKPGKPRRERRGQEYTLRDLAPPGRWYQTWNLTPAGFAVRDPDGALADLGRVDGPEVAAFRRLCRAAPYYPPHTIPNAAIVIEQHIERGILPLRIGAGPEGVEYNTLAEMAGRIPTDGIDFNADPARADVDVDDARAAGAVGVSDRDAAATIHRMHALGLVLLDDTDGAEFRVVPARPCDDAGRGRWLFLDEMTVREHADAEVVRQAAKVVATAEKGMGL